MLGSHGETDDAVQEAWLRLSRTDPDQVENLGGWLTTVVARVCLDMLRARQARSEPIPSEELIDEPLESDVVLAEAVGPALFVVLDSLAPAERVAFVLHDVFDVSFDDIASILERSPVAARQLASRARRRLRGASRNDPDEHAQLVSAFLTASREGSFERLLAVLSPEVALRADDLAVRTAAARAQRGAPNLVRETRGAADVAEVFAGRARGAVPARIDGRLGAVWKVGDAVRTAFIFDSVGGEITAITIVMEPAALARLVIEGA